MKKVISFMLMMILCLSLVACGSSQSEENEVDDNQDSAISEIWGSSDEEKEKGDVYYKVGDTVETDIFRVTIESAEFGIALNGDYVKNGIDEPTLSENYGLPVEYIDGESYLRVASTGHTLVVLELTLENLDRVSARMGSEDIKCIYCGEEYTVSLGNVNAVCYFDDDGSIHPYEYDSTTGRPTYYYSDLKHCFVLPGKSKSIRVYFDIPVEVDTSSDDFVLVLPIENSSDEHEEFYFSIN